MAATGLLATVLWFGGTGLLLFTNTVAGDLGFFFGVGLFFAPVAILGSFVLGVLLWRYGYSEDNPQLCGALLGAATAIGSLCLPAFLLAVFVAVDNVSRGEMAVFEAAVFALLLTPVAMLFAIIAAGWLVLPLGAFGGWYHERAKTAHDVEEPSVERREN